MLKLQTGSSVGLSNGMQAHITANQNELGSPIAGVEGGSNVIITSTLEGEPQTSGPFQGSGVLLLSYP